MNNMDLQGKVSIVTGGAKGLGKAYCAVLLRHGAKVSILDKDEDCGNKLQKELNEEYNGRVLFQKCDVSSLDDMKSAFKKTVEEFGSLDIVVNNAGILDEHNWRTMVEVDFVGVIHGIQLGFLHMSKDSGGHGGCIINTGSNAAFETFPLAPVYAACKHGVVGLTKSYGNDYFYNKTGVTVNALCPGPVDTELFYAFPEMCIDSESARVHNGRIVPAKPSHVAEGLITLLRDQKNGALLRVHSDGSFKYC